MLQSAVELRASGKPSHYGDKYKSGNSAPRHSAPPSHVQLLTNIFSCFEYLIIFPDTDSFPVSVQDNMLTRGYRGPQPSLAIWLLSYIHSVSIPASKGGILHPFHSDSQPVSQPASQPVNMIQQVGCFICRATKLCIFRNGERRGGRSLAAGKE